MTDQFDRSHSEPPARSNPPHRSGHGWIIAILALVIVALLVVAGILPRLRASAEVKKETNILAVPSVIVMQPKRCV